MNRIGGNIFDELEPEYFLSELISFSTGVITPLSVGT